MDEKQKALMEYHAAYDDLNTEILTALIEEAPDEIKPILSNYNVNITSDDFSAEVKVYDKDLLKQTLTFLKVKCKVAQKPKQAKAIKLGIDNLLHEKCDACQQYYVVQLHDEPTLRCRNCGQGCHEACYSICKQLPGIEWSCSVCNTQNSQQDLIKAETSDLDDNTHPVAANEPNTEKLEEEKLSEEKYEEAEVRQKSEMDTCKYFLRSRCKWGLLGKNCRFKHLKVCPKLINNGNKAPYGCTKGPHCPLFHPKICWSSLSNRTCALERCRFVHIKGTNRSRDVTPLMQVHTGPVWNNGNQPTSHPSTHNTQPPPSSQPQISNQPSTPNQQPPPHQQNELSFLDLMKEMKQQLEREMKEQREQLLGIHRQQLQLSQGYQALQNQITQPTQRAQPVMHLPVQHTPMSQIQMQQHQNQPIILQPPH